MWRSPVSAPALGAGGHRFESCYPDQTGPQPRGREVRKTRERGQGKETREKGQREGEGVRERRSHREKEERPEREERGVEKKEERPSTREGPMRVANIGRRKRVAPTQEVPRF